MVILPTDEKSEMNEVFIVGGGPSLFGKNLKQLANKNTIVINKSILHVPFPNYYLTMDYTSLRKIPVKGQPVNKVFVAKFSSLEDRGGALYDRRNNLVYTDLYSSFDMICIARHDNGFGTTWRDFCCGNHSGHAAIQFALLMGYERIYLLGFDYTTIGDHTHFHNGYGQILEWYNPLLQKYATNLLLALKDLNKFNVPREVISCSKISSLNTVLPYVEWEDTIA